MSDLLVFLTTAGTAGSIAVYLVNTSATNQRHIARMMNRRMAR